MYCEEFLCLIVHVAVFFFDIQLLEKNSFN